MTADDNIDFLHNELTVSTRVAAQKLFVSRGRLAELILSGRVELVGPQNLDDGRIRLRDLDSLIAELVPAGGVTARTRVKPAQVSRPQHAAVHLISDWGSATKVALQFALRQTYPTTLEMIGWLTDKGLVHQVGSKLLLTDKGVRYVEVHPRVS